MIEVVPGEVGANHIRLGISPLEEVLHAVRILSRPGRSPVHARWATANRHRLDAPELVELITGDVYFPDFLSPPTATTVEAQLAAVRATPLEQVALEIGMSVAGRDVPELDPAVARDVLATQMRECWDTFIAPLWPRIRAILDADHDYRRRQFGSGGLAAVLTGIHAGVTVDGPRILVPTRFSMTLRLDSRGLQLVPSVFATGLGMMTVPPWQPSLVYPARGTATLWEDVPPPSADALAGVIGRTKALLLRSLGSPASTTVLAARFGVAPSTVSEHLTALSAAGLLHGHRAGRSVQYQRSPLGDELVSATA